MYIVNVSDTVTCTNIPSRSTFVYRLKHLGTLQLTGTRGQERKQAMRAQQWEENAPAQESVELPGVLKEMQVGRWWGMVGRGPGVLRSALSDVPLWGLLLSAAKCCQARWQEHDLQVAQKTQEERKQEMKELKELRDAKGTEKKDEKILPAKLPAVSLHHVLCCCSAFKGCSVFDPKQIQVAHPHSASQCQVGTSKDEGGGSSSRVSAKESYHQSGGNGEERCQ